MPVSQRAMTPLSQKRSKTNNCVALANFSLEAETSPGAKNPCGVFFALGLVWFFSGHSLGSDFGILCAPHFGGDINCLLAALSRCSWWISSHWLMGSQSTYFVCQFYPPLGLAHDCPTFQRCFFFTSFYLFPNYSPRFQCFKWQGCQGVTHEQRLNWKVQFKRLISH